MLLACHARAHAGVPVGAASAAGRARRLARGVVGKRPPRRVRRRQAVALATARTSACALGSAVTPLRMPLVT
ncbi:hypothetical protein A4G23_02183 [Streptomyces rubrolavendulae]|uniref:Uncharacterized protein n=1 Tax=Streptomyces rubrolavendulae TaxID=285473 RepID=A0A1D8G1L3_9ACTN|nr:hypothetical protein A4G23_02183 [Streptomyces rubrolavendulae]